MHRLATRRLDTTTRAPLDVIATVLLTTAMASARDPVPLAPATEAEAPPTHSLTVGDPLIWAERLPHLRVTTRGKVLEVPDFSQQRQADPDPVRGTCQQTVTYSQASLTGGSYAVQAGLSEQESAGASYVIPADQFPITIRGVDIIWGVSGATEPTTTMYSVNFYSGVPNGSNFIIGFSSDGVILPNIDLPAGSNAVDVQITIDPTDPDQVVIPAPGNGSATFGIGWRIEKHNNPPADGCSSSPDAHTNAFPTTDTNGVSSQSGNWIEALNCQGNPCVPAGGGWTPFSGIFSLCRPHGDWTIRVTYEPSNCAAATGACCFTSSSTCAVLIQNDCVAQGGTYKGDGTTCAGQNCAPAQQACCFASSGGCIDFDPVSCANAGGVAAGVGTRCATYVCFPIGSCCLATGVCVDAASPSGCASQGGTFKGNGTTCASTQCPPPSGACCFTTGFCSVLTQAQCLAGGASWKGAGTNCADTNNDGIPDACVLQPCPGDFTGDRVRNTVDLSLLLSKFGQHITAGSPPDMNNDGVITSSDLGAFLRYFGVPCN